MSDSVKAEIVGVQELMAELRRLPEVLQQKIMRGAVGTAANVIKREAVMRAPVFTGAVSQGHPPPGALKAAIYATRLVDKCTINSEVWLVGVRQGKRARNSGSKTSKFGPTQGKNLDAYYASWVEYGHYARVSKSMSKDAKAAGRGLGAATWVAARPFMRPAFETKKGDALEAACAYIQRNLPVATASFRFLKAAA